MPVGTKYRDFNKETDLKVGNYVYASLFGGKRQGYITQEPVSLKNNTWDHCLMEDKATFISDIQYIRL